MKKTTTKTAAEIKLDAEILEIVRREFIGIETLEPRNLDRLDFHEVSVLAIERAMKAAYAAGRASR